MTCYMINNESVPVVLSWLKLLSWLNHISFIRYTFQES